MELGEKYDIEYFESIECYFCVVDQKQTAELP